MASASAPAPHEVLAQLASRNAESVQRLRELQAMAQPSGDEQQPTASAPSNKVSAQPSPSKPIRGHKPETIQELRRTAWILHQERRMFNRTALHAEEYERVMKDPAALALARDVATNVAAAVEIYGEEQALMRTYAVRSLGYAAEHGRPEIAEEAVDVLGRKLDESDNREKGIEHDYVDIATSYVRTLGRKALLDDPDSIWRRMHLSQRTSLEAGRALYDSGVLNGISEEERQRLSSSYDRYLAAVP